MKRDSIKVEDMSAVVSKHELIKNNFSVDVLKQFM